MVTHTTTIHGICPLNGRWDYYTLKISTSEFVDVEVLEEACNEVRGKTETQEAMAGFLRKLLPSHCQIELAGRHSQNTKTTVVLEESEVLGE